MSSLYRRTGIILKRQNVDSVDRMITLFAADGKHVLRARGTQKLESKLAGSLEPLTLVELTIAHGRHSDQVTGSSLHDAYRSIHASLPKIAAASLLASAVEALVHGIHDDHVPYRRIREALALVARSTTNRQLYLAASFGLWNLVAALGHPVERGMPAAPSARRLRDVLLHGDPRLLDRIRCSVATARVCLEGSVANVEFAAEREVPAARFFTLTFTGRRGARTR